MERRISADLYDFREPEYATPAGDGGLIPLLSAACLTAMMSVGVYISSAYPAYDGDTLRILWRIMSVIVVLALISIISILLMSRVCPSFWVFSNDVNRDTDLKCVFMWLTGTVVLADILLSFTANVQCMLKHLDNLSLYIYYAFAHVLYFMYFVMQNVFVQMYKNAIFYNRKIIHFCISFIVLANSTLGFSAYMGHYYTNQKANQTLSGNSSSEAKEAYCYINSEMGNLHEQLRPYLVPCRIEYYLLVAHFVFSVWPSIHDHTSNLQEALRTFVPQRNSLRVPVFVDEEQTYLRCQPNDVRNSGIFAASSHFLDTRKILIGYGIVSNIILFVGSWMQVQYQTNVFDSHFSNYLFVFYKVYTLIILILTFHALSLERNRLQQTGGIIMSEYFLVLVGACATAVCTFDIVVSWKLKDGIDIAFAISSTVTITDIHYQVILILMLKRTNFSKIDQNFITLILLLAIANFLHWISDTFIVVPHFKRERYVEDVCGKEIADFVHYVLFPLVMYFRLISSIELIDFYRKRC